jgi:multicomponent K+:H+ antiporter subunit G
VAIAAALYFSFLDRRVALHPLLIPLLLAITVPVTSVLLLARVSLFRRRSAGEVDTPPALAPLEDPLHVDPPQES